MDPIVDGITWLPWGPDVFARARAECKPIVLSIVAPWSVGCHEMDRGSYADAAIVESIRQHFIPVRVDADQRPDLADRYDFAGLPTTAFLTPEGRILGGGTFVAPDRMRLALARLSAAAMPGETGREEPRGEGAEHELDDAALTDVVFSTFDAVHAGFGAAPKFPHTAAVRLALDLYSDGGDPAMLETASRTLDAIGWGGLYDDIDGGFFRCASEDWSHGPPEKLLTGNAALLDLYVHAGTIASNERWFARAVDIVHFIERKLIAANGAWRLSACAEPGRQFSDSNAVAASAMLHAARVFDDDALGRRAIAALERVLLSSYKPGHGVAHSAAGVRGLLVDQVAMAAANLDAWESTGNVVYRMMAEELMHFAVRTMWDEKEGGFFDRAVADGDATQGLLAMRLKPFVLNCEAAVVLRRLAEGVNEPDFARRAAGALAAVSGRAASQGPLAAHYLIARRAVLR